ncbi:hypothetical protein AK812_SmicGene15959 [Symbiodinium microadriaticum]|uniref:Uncharacterized protein n=1 Tax=Symbiodinium microadriaticum TaxID=2951 RepID=A0A1Q9E1M1_SYMMI|nr:hypothetical protein AK812_SmicGene15959 [Symbiodinium microadriaticum]
MECSFCSSSLHDVEDDEDDDGSAFASDSSVLVFLGADWALEAGVLQTASAEGAEDGEVVLFASATGTDEVDLHLCIGFNNAAANAVAVPFTENDMALAATVGSDGGFKSPGSTDEVTADTTVANMTF